MATIENRGQQIPNSEMLHEEAGGPWEWQSGR